MNTICWTKKEIDTALRLRKEGMSVLNIAHSVGHGYSATRDMILRETGHIREYSGCNETCPEYCPYPECLRPERECSERTRWI